MYRSKPCPSQEYKDTCNKKATGTSRDIPNKIIDLDNLFTDPFLSLNLK